MIFNQRTARSNNIATREVCRVILERSACHPERSEGSRKAGRFLASLRIDRWRSAMQFL